MTESSSSHPSRGGYEVTIKSSAVKELAAVEPKKQRQHIAKKIAALASIPRPPGCEKLAGQDDAYRIRHRRYRIVYTIFDRTLTVEVIAVKHRKDVYR